LNSVCLTVEERLSRLESRVGDLERLSAANVGTPGGTARRGWRWFVGVFANAPDFDEVERVGREWRNADRPAD
jgi:hypothetical protein